MAGENINLVLRVRAQLGDAIRQLDRLEKETRGAGRAGATAGTGLDRAADAADRLEREARGAAAGADRMEKEIREAGRAADAASRGWRRASLSVRDFFGAAFGANVADRILARIARTAQETAEAVIRGGLEIERLERRFRFAAGSAAAGAAELRFLRAEADRLGLDFRSAANDFSLFAAATRGTALEGRETQRIFSAVASAARVMGLSTEQTSGALLALQQIVSKGVVSAEELRQQLGERLPGAFRVAAEALGVSTAELGKMLERGEVLAEDFLPRFASQLEKHVAGDVKEATESAEADFNRLSNAIDRIGQSIGRVLLPPLAALAEVAAGILEEDTLQPVRAAAITVEGSAARAASALYLQSLRANELRAALGRAREEATESAEAAEFQARQGTLTAEGARKVAAARREVVRLLEEELAVRAEIAAVDEADFVAAPRPDRTPQDGRERAAAERQAAELVRIREAAEIETLRASGRRTEISEREEAALVARIESMTLASAEGREAAIAAVRRRGAQERARILSDELNAETDAIRAEEERRAKEIEDAVERGRAAAARREAALQRIRDEANRQAERTDPARGARAALERLAEEAASSGRLVGDAIESGFGRAEDAVARFVATGKASFSGLAASIAADLSRLATRSLVTGPLYGWLASLLPGPAAPIGGTAGLGSLRGYFSQLHGGGRAGDGRVRRLADPAIFDAAPRLHSGGVAGLRADEVPAILQRGETVLPVGARMAPPAVSIEMRNEGRPLEVEQDGAPRFDGDRWVVGLVVRNIDDGGPIRHAILRLGASGQGAV